MFYKSHQNTHAIILCSLFSRSNAQGIANTTQENLPNATGMFNTSHTGDALAHDAVFYMEVYVALVLSSFAFSMIANSAVYVACLASSKNLHDSMFARVISAPTSFFDKTPIGKRNANIT